MLKDPDGKVATAEHAGTTCTPEEASPRRTGVALDEELVAEKPRASEEIVIEEINIDGMCGVY